MQNCNSYKNLLKEEKGGQIDPEMVEYTYNPLNQLIQYEDNDGNITSYTYDGTGMRTSKTSNNTTTKYYWDRGYISNEAVGSSFTDSIDNNWLITDASKAFSFLGIESYVTNTSDYTVDVFRDTNSGNITVYGNVKVLH